MDGNRPIKVLGIQATEVNFEEARYVVPAYAAHRPAARCILEKRYYEPQLHALIGAIFRAVEGDMLHAGTFFGDMLPSFSKKVRGTIYAFEPVRENYLLASEVVEVNKLRNVFLMHAGLAETLKILQIFTGRGKQHIGGGSTFDVPSNEQDANLQQVPVLAIDNLMLRNLSVIQLDVEGFELNALSGACSTLERCRPILILEDNKKNCAPFLSARDYVSIGMAGPNTVWATSERSDWVKMLMTEAGLASNIGKA